MDRRDALVTLASAVLPGSGQSRQPAPCGRMPAIFLAHGHPLWPSDPGRVADLAAWSSALPRPRAVLMVSAHWTEAPATLGATETVPLVHDFYGFPEELYRVQYRAPGAPALAARVEALLRAAGHPVRRSRRGLDHGAYVPMLMMYPAADVPVLQLSLPTLEPQPLLALGRALAPLRDEGVLIVGSGFLIHNLRMFNPAAHAPAPGWAQEFDAWAADALGRRDVDAVLAYREKAPGVRTALPTHEHFVPVVVTLGASVDRAEPVRFPVTGWEGGSLTRRSVQMG
jgi:4,5-DOPA dioxygenase extradiol